MRSTKSIILLVIALGCGTIAAIGMHALAQQDSADKGETETIYVAATSVPMWSKLNEQLVTQEEWPIDKIPQGAARSLEEFEGKSSRYPLYQGEPILVTKLADGDSKIASIRIPEGHQVFAVKVDKESALSGLIHPGDRVDVLVFIRSRSGGTERVRTGTRTIMRNITVFAVNDQISRSQDEETTIDAKTVSLLVLPEQSERLLLAKQLGTIHLALRKPGDETKVHTDGAEPGDLDSSSDGSDGMVAEKPEAKPTGGIFRLLDEMKGNNSKAVDSSKATASTTMVIMSPDSVIGTFSFSEKAKQGGLYALPNELLNAVGGGVDDQAGPEPITDTGQSDDDSQSDDDVEAEETLDAADLGL